MRSQLAIGLTGLMITGLVAAGCGSSPNEPDRKQSARNAARAGAPTPTASSTQAANPSWPATKPVHGSPQLRAVIADADSGAIHVVDLTDGKTVEKLEVDGPAWLTLAEDGTQVVAAQTEANAVHIVDAGIRWDGHGDHQDPAHIAPTVRPGKLTVPHPNHVVPHGHHVTVFADGDGSASVIDADSKGQVEGERRVESAKAHHGVAVTLEDGRLLTTIPHPSDPEALPIGVQAHDAKGAKAERFANCPDLHGEFAATETTVLFGCSDGILVLEAKAGKWTSHKLPNPKGLGKDERVSNFAGAGTDRILGTLGDKAMAIIDLAKNRMTRVDLPDVRAGYLWDPEWLQYVVLTDDGNLQAIDPETGALKHTLEVLEPFEYTWEKPTKLALGDRAIYLTDPNSKKLIEIGVSSKGFTVKRTLQLDFVPLSLAVVGLPVEHHD